MVFVSYIDLGWVTEAGCSQGSPPWELRCQLYSGPFVFSSLLSLLSSLFSPPGTTHGNITANARERTLPCIEIVQFSFTQLRKLSWTLKWAWSVSFIVLGSHWHPGYELLWCGGYIKYQVSRIKHKNQWRHAQTDIQHLYLHTWAQAGAGPDLITWISSGGESIRERHTGPSPGPGTGERSIIIESS